MGISKPHLLRPGRRHSSWTICIITLCKGKRTCPLVQLGLPGRRRDNSEGTYLSVGLTACFIRLAEVEHQFVSAFLAQLLHYVEGAFAEGLTHRVEEHKYQVGLFSCTGKKENTQEARRSRGTSQQQRHTQPRDGAVDIKRVDHVPIHQPRGVHIRHQTELLLLGGGDLCRQVVRNTWNTERP